MPPMALNNVCSHILHNILLHTSVEAPGVLGHVWHLPHATKCGVRPSNTLKHHRNTTLIEPQWNLIAPSPIYRNLTSPSAAHTAVLVVANHSQSAAPHNHVFQSHPASAGSGSHCMVQTNFKSHTRGILASTGAERPSHYRKCPPTGCLSAPTDHGMGARVRRDL